MNVLKPLLSSTALTALAFVPAHAQPMAAPYSWAGFYVGLNLGGAWASSSYTELTGPPFPAAAAANTNQPAGVIGGFQAGYNWQTGSVVMGLEGDVAFLSANASTAVLPFVITHNSRISALATLRGRLGLAMDNTLVYVTGGGALAAVKNQIVDLGPAFVADRNSPTLGWTAGAGIEHAFNAAWSGKIEYLYAGFPNSTVGASGYLFNLKDSVSVVRAGVNYHF